MNESDAKSLKITGYRYLSFGAYGIVFKSEDGSKVLKIFHADGNRDKAKAAFEDEARAYEIATKASAISRYVSKHFSRRDVGEVMDARTGEPSTLIFGDLAYEIEFFETRPVKANRVAHKLPHLADIRQAFMAAGIKYVEDIDVVIDGDEVIAVLDFAINGPVEE